MAKKQTYYYVMVMTDNGPVFVTSVSITDKTAYWNKAEKPFEMSKYLAEDLTIGLNLNGNLAYTVSAKWEIGNQPYFYNKGKFVWQMADDTAEVEDDI